MRLLKSLRSPSFLIALGVFVVAFVARILWATRVDSPFDNVFSDMAGYVSRARMLAFAEPDTSPAFDTYYPPGVHMLYAAEWKLAGELHHGWLLYINTFWGAVVAPCASLLAMRIVARKWVAALVGLFMALWYPLLSFVGFFSSEQPFAGAIALGTLLLVRQVESGKSAVLLGVVSAIAYLERPQIVLTLAALSAIGALLLARGWLGAKVSLLRFEAAPALRLGRLLVAGGILTAAVAFGAWRYHKLCGRWGLISDNGSVARLGADTDYGVIRSTDGFFLGSPPKLEHGENRELLVTGYVGNPVTIDRARREAVAKMKTSARIVRWIRNTRLLFYDNSFWPEVLHVGKGGWRYDSYVASQHALLGALVPLAVIGLFSTFRRPNTVQVLCVAHVLTMLVTAAFFCGEMRYRVPYDLFIVLLAVVGLRAAGAFVDRPTLIDGQPPAGLPISN